MVPGTGYRLLLILQTDVVYTTYVVSSFVVSVSYEKKYMFLFLIRSIRNYTCLHEFRNEVTNRRGQKTPFLNLMKKNFIRNGQNKNEA